VVVNSAVWLWLGVIHRSTPGQHAFALITGGLLIAAVSLMDDLHPISYKIRLATQGVAATVFIGGVTYWQTLSLPVVGSFSIGLGGMVLTWFWIVGLTNAYNFMDGVDGMAGGQAVAAGVGWVILGLLTGQLVLVLLGGCLAATSLGFLIHNWHPARIFMGDVGATFLGYSFAAITVMATHDVPKLGLAGVLLVWPSIFDTGFTVLRRLRRRENIFVGHRTFLFHRLTSAGWSHATAALLYIPLPILGAVLACTWAEGPRPLHIGITLVAMSACFALWSLVRHQERQQVAPARLVPAPLPPSGLVPVAAMPARPGAIPWLEDRGHSPSRGAWDGTERRSGTDRRGSTHRSSRDSRERRTAADRRQRKDALATPRHRAGERLALAAESA
jgi:UDP-N-acetylmuramyl pentapeptide phosphotransferase/UDP-N-acetylglucosamine-1-phosphate transferase